MTGDNTEAQVPEQQERKTFTQEELNKVVQERLKREREKYADHEGLKEKASKFDEVANLVDVIQESLFQCIGNRGLRVPLRSV